MNRKTSLRVKKLLAYSVLFIALAITLVPIIWILLTSLKSATEAFSIPPVWLFKPQLSGYFGVVDDGFLQTILNSTIVALSSTLLAIFLGTPASYALSRFDFPGKTDFQYFILSLYFVPSIAILIPLLVLWKTLGLLGSYIPVIIMHSIMNIPLVVWVLKGFIDEIPISIEEAALLDGCNYFQTFFRIITPLSVPGITVVGILSFIFSWNEFIFALVMTGGDTQTVPIGIQKYITPAGVMWNKIGAASILGMIIPLILILLVRERLAQGLSLGAVK
jgi:multiple sugar transport system permease protein